MSSELEKASSESERVSSKLKKASIELQKSEKHQDIYIYIFEISTSSPTHLDYIDPLNRQFTKF